MGIDYYTCCSCDKSFPDCGSYYNCEFCGSMFCSRKCADLKLIEVDEDDEEDSGEDTYVEEYSCCVCRKEDAPANVLLNVLLKHFKISYEDALKIWQEEEDIDRGE
jgi:hypothetical protein